MFLCHYLTSDHRGPRTSPHRRRPPPPEPDETQKYTQKLVFCSFCPGHCDVKTESQCDALSPLSPCDSGDLSRNNKTLELV